MHICCEMLSLTTTNARMLLDIVDSSTKKYFCNGLSKLGWCAHYMLDRRSLDNFRTTRITDFYWINNSPNRLTKQRAVNQTEICQCFHCLFLDKE